ATRSPPHRRRANLPLMLDTLESLRERLAPQYDVERQIGAGGMARVYLAVQQHPHRRVAIKVIDPELSNRLLRERFIREVDLSSKLSHPHIVPIFSAGEVDGLFYYVMPYVEGESLRHRLLRERQLPLETALHIARDVADALAFAHGQGIIHRDIKPENILLSGDHAIVADFGIARAISVARGEHDGTPGAQLDRAGSERGHEASRRRRRAGREARHLPGPRTASRGPVSHGDRVRDGAGGTPLSDERADPWGLRQPAGTESRRGTGSRARGGGRRRGRPAATQQRVAPQ